MDTIQLKNKSIIQRILHNRFIHIMLPPSGSLAARWIGGWMLFVLALGRLGVLPASNMPTIIPPMLYGAFMLIGSLALLLTIQHRLTWYGRLIAAYGFALLGGFAIDILPAFTSAFLMVIPAYALLGEVGVLDEC